jgi:hypothetical protein
MLPVVQHKSATRGGVTLPITMVTRGYPEVGTAVRTLTRGMAGMGMMPMQEIAL